MFRRFQFPILAGLLIGTSYIPFPPWALFFGIVPLWLFALRAESAKQAFFAGWLTQFVLNAIGFHWIAQTAVEFGHFPLIAGLLVLVGFCAIAHLYYPVSLAAWYLLRKKLPMSDERSMFVLAGLLLFFNFIFPVLFPWHFGYPWLWAKFPGAQAADLIGFEGLNTISVFINAFIAVAWLHRRTRPVFYKNIGIAVGLFVVVNVVGLFKMHTWDHTDSEIKILAVQGNIGNWEKIEAEQGDSFKDIIIQRYVNQSQAALQAHPDADVMIWPETAFPGLLDRARQFDPTVMALKTFLNTAQKPLLTGGYSLDPRTRASYNGLFAVDSTGVPAFDPPYRKTILLAFGEYFPGSEWFPIMMKLFPNQSAFGRGPGPMLMDWNGWKLGPQICYEGLYPWFTRGLVNQGADVIVNVTNDSWFGKTFEPYQHLYMTLARAIEFRRPLMRSTNTGITTAILANGAVLEKSPLHQEWAGLFRIPYLKNPPKTVYSYVEPLWGWFLVLLNLLLLVFPRGRIKVA